MKKLSKWVVIIGLIGINSCTTIRYCTPYELPPTPKLPDIEKTEVACLTDETQEKLLLGDIKFVNWIKQVQTVHNITKCD